jgi:hypothetical protein
LQYIGLNRVSLHNNNNNNNNKNNNKLVLWTMRNSDIIRNNDVMYVDFIVDASKLINLL